MKKITKSLGLILRMWRDLFIRFLPFTYNKKKYSYAFLVHLRDLEDVYRFYPFLRKVSPRLVEWLLMRQWPYVLGYIDGLFNQKGQVLNGYIITIPLTAKLMVEHNHLARKQIERALKLGEKLGVKLVGLGALIASVTKGGRDLVDTSKVKITTGHAYTAYNVSDYLFRINDKLGINKEEVVVAIVGAAGFIGSGTAELVAREGYKNFLLIDLESKKERIQALLSQILKFSPQAKVEVSHHISEIKRADYVIAVTNAPEALIRSEDLRSGTVVIDDAIPSDVHEEVFDRDDVLVINGGAVTTPGVSSRFNFGLHGSHTNFCCVAEILTLARREWQNDFVVGVPTLEQIDQVANWGRELGFNRSVFQDKLGLIEEKRIKKVRDIIMSR